MNLSFIKHLKEILSLQIVRAKTKMQQKINTKNKQTITTNKTKNKTGISKI